MITHNSCVKKKLNFAWTRFLFYTLALHKLTLFINSTPTPIFCLVMAEVVDSNTNPLPKQTLYFYGEQKTCGDAPVKQEYASIFMVCNIILMKFRFLIVSSIKSDTSISNTALSEQREADPTITKTETDATEENLKTEENKGKKRSMEKVYSFK